jgi:hypothetical protein
LRDFSSSFLFLAEGSLSPLSLRFSSSFFFLAKGSVSPLSLRDFSSSILTEGSLTTWESLPVSTFYSSLRFKLTCSFFVFSEVKTGSGLIDLLSGPLIVFSEVKRETLSRVTP